MQSRLVCSQLISNKRSYCVKSCSILDSDHISSCSDSVLRTQNHISPIGTNRQPGPSSPRSPDSNKHVNSIPAECLVLLLVSAKVPFLIHEVRGQLPSARPKTCTVLSSSQSVPSSSQRCPSPRLHHQVRRDLLRTFNPPTCGE